MRVWTMGILAATLALPVAASGQSEASAIQTMMQKSAADWNRGDIDAFATSYKNSPDILFLGKTISRGYAGMLATYKEHYPTREKMGTLVFSQLQVQPLDELFATTTGHFHLERTAAGGGNADGYFLLVLEKTKNGWKIVRDDTTALPKNRVAYRQDRTSMLAKQSADGDILINLFPVDTVSTANQLPGISLFRRRIP